MRYIKVFEENILILRKVVIRELLKKINKGAWGMPRLSEAKKDVPSCEKLRGSAEEN